MNEFNEWNKVKINIDLSRETPFFNEREIWWCHLGKNIGREINGKSNAFTRPVLIFHKISNQLFIGIPLTHTLKEDLYNTSFYFDYDFSCACLSQIRTLSAKRLVLKIGFVSKYIQKKVGGKLGDFV